MRIKVDSTFPDWPWAHQMALAPPGIELVFSGDAGAFDGWVVFEGLQSPKTIRCPPSRTILITGEPSPVRTYDRGFLRQFARVITTQPTIAAELPATAQLTNPALPWWIGIDPVQRTVRQPLSELISSRPAIHLASVICSRKTMTAGHRRRLAFVEQLQRELGEKITVCGRGFQPIADKAQALLGYRYHVAIENTCERHYWSEKLADPILAGCIVLYHGCPDVTDWFPGPSLIPIDIEDPQVFQRIAQRLAKTDDDDEMQASIEDHRRRLIDTYAFAPQVAKWMAGLPESDSTAVTLRPEGAKWRRWLGRVLRR